MDTSSLISDMAVLRQTLAETQTDLSRTRADLLASTKVVEELQQRLDQAHKDMTYWKHRATIAKT